MSLPTFLVFEVRAAFRCSARQHLATRRCPYSTTTRLLARLPPKKSTSASTRPPAARTSRTLPAAAPRAETVPQASSSKLPTDVASTSETTDLTIPPSRSTSLDHPDSQSNIPTKVLPPATLGLSSSSNTKTHTLSPLQRLHIEHLTRHPPTPQPPKPFAERLLIYNISTYKITNLIFWRILFISGIGFMTVLWLPSYILHSPETPNWAVVLIWLGSFLPLLIFNRLTRSIITEAFLNLPTPASRASPQAAMAYAKNLPRDASLQVRFLRWTGINGMMRIQLSECAPLRGVEKAWWNIANFKVPMTSKRRAESSFLKPALSEFFVYSSTAGGKRARDTIPGLWEVVYKRLTGRDAVVVSKWGAAGRR